MKIIVQDPDTSFYFKHPRTWTPNEQEAFDFQDTRAAAEFCRENNLADSRIVVTFEDDRTELRVPVGIIRT
ncbi:MAG: hypothetical protein DME19_00800 [Verrucomicrobia bacterium]|nr:MAG: hypothetical protein DME19_00800 [Verrucomicrobiota bacterium]